MRGTASGSGSLAKRNPAGLQGRLALGAGEEVSERLDIKFAVTSQDSEHAASDTQVLTRTIGQSHPSQSNYIKIRSPARHQDSVACNKQE